MHKIPVHLQSSTSNSFNNMLTTLRYSCKTAEIVKIYYEPATELRLDSEQDLCPHSLEGIVEWFLVKNDFRLQEPPLVEWLTATTQSVYIASLLVAAVSESVRLRQGKCLAYSAPFPQFLINASSSLIVAIASHLPTSATSPLEWFFRVRYCGRVCIWR